MTAPDVREAGHGSPVLLLHGAAGPDSVDTLFTHLAGGHRVIAPVHPGFGDTTRPDDLDSVAKLARLYLDLLASLDVTGATVVGVSFGGWVAAELATIDQWGRVARLVLIDAIGPHIPGHPIRPPSGPPPTTGPGGPPRAGMAALTAYTGPDLHDPTLLDRIRELDLPALLIWGEHDPVISPDFGRAYAAAFPDARFELIPGGGHLPMREAPEQTFAALDAFLNESGNPQ
ncbi:alpha/beta fold hydrolase [Dactylosporangium siamense]|uniref:Alpha/beta hydrolase n=1 Tax=Dactylosporangium siamense TaxID=685454 RepID=A0A919PME8_9ACTN|nr:alpha/beta hydrolase [Dactylosporangium siamense]GIG46822.1 alpha/beta hydrolase [Dactylosporangium siamense]